MQDEGGSTRGATCFRYGSCAASREDNGSSRLPYDSGLSCPCGSETRGDFSEKGCQLTPAADSLKGCSGYLSLGYSLKKIIPEGGGVSSGRPRTTID